MRSDAEGLDMRPFGIRILLFEVVQCVSSHDAEPDHLKLLLFWGNPASYRNFSSVLHCNLAGLTSDIPDESVQCSRAPSPVDGTHYSHILSTSEPSGLQNRVSPVIRATGRMPEGEAGIRSVQYGVQEIGLVVMCVCFVPFGPR
jgi:hypothetical protein